MGRIKWEQVGCLLCGLAVVLGAFGAHFLKRSLSPSELGTFETAVRYQMYHGFALLILGISYPQSANRRLSFAGIGFSLGTVLFSGSLYLILLGCPSWLGIFTPIGGCLYICAWTCFAWHPMSRASFR